MDWVTTTLPIELDTNSMSLAKLLLGDVDDCDVDEELLVDVLVVDFPLEIKLSDDTSMTEVGVILLAVKALLESWAMNSSGDNSSYDASLSISSVVSRISDDSVDVFFDVEIISTELWANGAAIACGVFDGGAGVELVANINFIWLLARSSVLFAKSIWCNAWICSEELCEDSEGVAAGGARLISWATFDQIDGFKMNLKVE